MPQFCVNKNAQSNGDHEVHDLSLGTSCLPIAANRQDLGSHVSCVSAVQVARRYYTQVNGCAWCAPSCHTS